MEELDVEDLLLNPGFSSAAAGILIDDCILGWVVGSPVLTTPNDHLTTDLTTSGTHFDQ